MSASGSSPGLRPQAAPQDEPDITSSLTDHQAEAAQGFDQLRNFAPTSGTAPFAKMLSRGRAKAAYTTIQNDYPGAGSDLALATADIDRAALHAAVVQASAGYEQYLAALGSTAWPASAQPYVDNYLQLAPTIGRDRFTEAKSARPIADLEHAEGVKAMLELAHVRGRRLTPRRLR